MNNIQRTEEKETTRTEAFSDGVFAIAITLLILEIRVPHAGEGESLVDLLLKQWPSYMAYIVSFMVIAVMWVNHHNLFKYIRRVDNVFLFINSVLLMIVTAFNFSTTLLADYILEPQHQQVAGVIYAGAGIVVAILFSLLWGYATGRGQLVSHELHAEQIKSISDRYRFGPLFYLAALLLVFVNVWLSLALQFGLAVYFSLTDSSKVGMEKS